MSGQKDTSTYPSPLTFLMKPIIAIVGRPNVGKSTLFNRLAGKRQAIVEDEPGVTRDRNYAEVSWDDCRYILIDTGGFEPAAKERLQQQVREQAEVAIEEADLILFLMDGKEGLMPADLEVAAYLRKSGKPTFYIVNKIDGETHEDRTLDFYRLGVEEVYSISAQHSRGVSDLMDEVCRRLPAPAAEEEKGGDEIRVALVGRPNVGKSSLLNRLIGKPRAVVDPTPGTTRDSIDIRISREGREYIFVDTAGIRRKSKISLRLEKYAVIRALKSLERGDVALILLDGFEGLTDQDARIMESAEENGRAMILVVNKWDLVEKDSATLEKYKERIHQALKTFDYVPVLFISALTGQRVANIFAAIDQAVTEHRKRIPTSELNRWLRETMQINPPPLFHKHPVRIYYVSQVSVSPPTFVFSANDPRAVGETYRRYLARRLRDSFGFGGTPLRLYFRERKKEK